MSLPDLPGCRRGSLATKLLGVVLRHAETASAWSLHPIAPRRTSRRADGRGYLTHEDSEAQLCLKKTFSGELGGPEAVVPLAPAEGWVWRVKDVAGRLHARTTSNAETPLQQGYVPLLTPDIWENASYVDDVDDRNERARYVQTFLDHLLNWDFVAANHALAPE